MKRTTNFFLALFFAICIACLCSCANRPTALPGAVHSPAGEASEADAPSATLPLDTILFANGHVFGHRGDVTMWGGWYFDTIPVGSDEFLIIDSVGPSFVTLNLVTKKITVDFADPDAPEKLRRFFCPVPGFQRFEDFHEEIIDSVITHDNTVLEYTGSVSFLADLADSTILNADKINRFVAFLAGISENEKTDVPALSALFAGIKSNKCYRPLFTADPHDMKTLSDFYAKMIFENWRRANKDNFPSYDNTLAIRAHVSNPAFVTFSKYEYMHEGLGHGMYTKSFHTLDLRTGKQLRNKDIFRPGSLDKVKYMLFEVMAHDRRYTDSFQGIRSAADVEDAINSWRDPDVSGINSSRSAFALPEAALAESGVIFSFQPYQIDCWAAGAYHFIVPYQAIQAYLTPAVIKLIAQAREN